MGTLKHILFQDSTSMSRKFNTNKFIKDVLNDRYALVKPSWYSFGAAKEMAYSSHTIACCLSKPRVWVEDGKSMLRVWLQYACGVEEEFLDEPSGRAERLYLSIGTPLAFLCSPYVGSGMPRSSLGNLTEVHTSNNVCSLTSELGFMASRAYVYELMKLCPCEFDYYQG